MKKAYDIMESFEAEELEVQSFLIYIYNISVIFIGTIIKHNTYSTNKTTDGRDAPLTSVIYNLKRTL
jgi:hypothetical protein